MSSIVTDAVCIITGAASGIGLACARLFAMEGYKLVLVDKDENGLRSSTSECEKKTQVMSITSDVSDEREMADMAASARHRFGRIDILIAAAGILRLSPQLTSLVDMDLEEWRRIIDVNLTGTFLSNRAVLPMMLSQRRGDIINISSVSGRQGKAFDSAYSASKFGIIGLSESLHAEVAGQGVRVQTLLPEAVATPLWRQNPSTALPPKQTLTPERVAEVILYMVTLPRDAYLLNPVLAPLKTRHGRFRET